MTTRFVLYLYNSIDSQELPVGELTDIAEFDDARAGWDYIKRRARANRTWDMPAAKVIVEHIDRFGVIRDYRQIMLWGADPNAVPEPELTKEQKLQRLRDMKAGISPEYREHLEGILACCDADEMDHLRTLLELASRAADPNEDDHMQAVGWLLDMIGEGN